MDNVEQFIEDYNNLEKFPNVSSLIEEYGISERTLRRWAASLKEDNYPLIDRSKTQSSVTKYCPHCGYKVKLSGKMIVGRDEVVRYRCTNCSRSTSKPLDSQDDYNPIIDENVVKQTINEINSLQKKKTVMRYVVTSAQNNTEVNKKFFKSIQAYCEYNDAHLLVIPLLYRNPTKDTDFNMNDYWYPAEIQKYLINKPVVLNKNLAVMADVKIQATAADPLTGLETISGTKSAIFGHGQMRMKMVATPQDKLPKMLHTTGSISEKNFSDTKAGAKARHHFSTAALVVGCVDNRFHIRELSADNSGAFYDLDKYYDGDIVTEGHSIDALVAGDSHVRFIDEDVKACTYLDNDSIVNVLKPKKMFFHDVLDFYSANHHHTGNRLTQYVKAVTGMNDVRRELDECVDFLNEVVPEDSEAIIVASNHNDAISRWMNSYHPDKDPYNALIYHELCSAVYSEATFGDSGVEAPHPLELYCRGKLNCKYEFLVRSKSYIVHDIDCSHHGDRGSNGARGNARAFAKSSYRCIVGHSHSPEIFYGTYQTGTSSRLKLEYNSGLSSWLQSHVIVYPNGKRTHLHIIEGEWRA